MFGLHQLLWDIRKDRSLARRYRESPQDVLARYELTAAEREAFRDLDFARLYGMGANPYLLYFCALQLGVDRDAYYAALRGLAGERADG